METKTLTRKASRHVMWINLEPWNQFISHTNFSKIGCNIFLWVLVCSKWPPSNRLPKWKFCSHAFTSSDLKMTARIHHNWLHECAVHAVRKKLKLISDGCDSCTRNAHETIVTPTMGQVESAFGGSVESGVRRSVLGWCVRQWSGMSRSEYIFEFGTIHFTKKFHKCFLSMRFAKIKMQ